jgi:ketosteroid isomerase-like protein
LANFNPAVPQTLNSPSDPLAAAVSALTAEVLAVEGRWTAAHLAGDFATLAELMAPDYVRIEPGGSVAGRAAVLAAYRPEHRHWDYAAGDEYDVHIYGDLTDDPSNDPRAVLTALVTGRWTARGTNHGAPFDYAACFLSVYVRRGGRWQMVAEQSTPIR